MQYSIPTCIVMMNRYHSKAGQLQVVNSISTPMFHLITSVQLKNARIELHRDIILIEMTMIEWACGTVYINFTAL